MPSPALQDLESKVTSTSGLAPSILAYIQGESARITAAVEAALALGATEAELAPVREAAAEMLSRQEAIVAAIQANS